MTDTNFVTSLVGSKEEKTPRGVAILLGKTGVGKTSIVASMLKYPEYFGHILLADVDQGYSALRMGMVHNNLTRIALQPGQNINIWAELDFDNLQRYAENDDIPVGTLVFDGITTLEQFLVMRVGYDRGRGQNPAFMGALSGKDWASAQRHSILIGYSSKQADINIIFIGAEDDREGRETQLAVTPGTNKALSHMADMIWHMRITGGYHIITTGGVEKLKTRNYLQRHILEERSSELSALHQKNTRPYEFLIAPPFEESQPVYTTFAELFMTFGEGIEQERKTRQA